MIPILILVGIISCSAGTDDSYSGRQEIQSMEESMAIGDYIFVNKQLDSSYAEFWCSIDILSRTTDQLESLDLSIMANFLATFHSNCNDNVEYSEWSNELLFEVCLRKPELIHHLLSKNSSLDRDEILKQLKTPIKDNIHVNEILEKCRKLEPLEFEESEIWKNKMIKALERSISQQ